MVDENTTQPSKAEDKEERFVRIRRRYRMCVEAIADQRHRPVGQPLWRCARPLLPCGRRAGRRARRQA